VGEGGWGVGLGDGVRQGKRKNEHSGVNAALKHDRASPVLAGPGRG